MSDDHFSLDDFNGLAKLFPLANVVLFPGVIQPLHIFEGRYKELTADALAHDRLIAMALTNKSHSPSVFQSIRPTLCLGRIFQEDRLPNGRFNLLLHGVARARILQEVKSGKPYRLARVEVLQDIPPVSVASARELREELGERMAAWFSGHEASRDQILKLLKGDLTLGNLCDIFSFALPIDCSVKMELLEMLDVEDRAGLLISQVKRLPPLPREATPFPSNLRKYPCQFSDN
ncbi:MAG: hypothetical protein EXR99_06180 [Gemmataceae bacterium]|nr:hypothetical protein [Gemmataceae bacterium]